jgi:phospholipid/cholesterol/gamma-HCH transport system substrate-binding protein
MKGQTLGAFVKLLIFALVTVVATALLVIVIQNRSFGATHTYTAMFSDATGLQPGDQVKVAGVRVGTVSSVAVDDSGAQPGTNALVKFTVDTNVPVFTSTQVDIRFLNLIGQRYVALVEQAGNNTAQPIDSVIPPSRTQPSLDLTELFNGFRPLFKALTPKDVNSFALEIVKTLQGEGGTIQDLVAKSASLTNTVANRDAVIGQVVSNLLKVLNTVQAHDTGLGQLIDQLQRLVTGLADNRGVIAASLGNIDALAGQSATLLKQIRPSLRPDIKNLGSIANSLDTTKTCPGYFSDPGLMSNAELAKYLQQHGVQANNNCNGPNTLTEFLQREPTKISQIIRTGSYGGFFNFYLCDLNLANSSAAITINAQACGS